MASVSRSLKTVVEAVEKAVDLDKQRQGLIEEAQGIMNQAKELEERILGLLGIETELDKADEELEKIGKSKKPMDTKSAIAALFVKRGNKKMAVGQITDALLANGTWITKSPQPSTIVRLSMLEGSRHFKKTGKRGHQRWQLTKSGMEKYGS